MRYVRRNRKAFIIAAATVGLTQIRFGANQT